MYLNSKIITLDRLIDQLQKIQEEHGKDVDVFIRVDRHEKMIGRVRYVPETDKEIAAVILS